ncbi:MAG: energy-coupled thiamine transporter ThiT [Coprobacillus sp.]
MEQVVKRKETLSVKMMSNIAMFMALQIVLELAFKIIPGQPQGGSITLALLPILLASYLLGAKAGLIVGIGSCALQFALGMAVYFGPWSVALDYLIPLAVVGIAVIFKNIKMGKYTLYTGIIITMILKFISHYLSGAWLFAEYAPEGVNSWVYSFGYNIIYCLPTLIISYIAFIVIYPRLEKIFHK